jgi:GntR family transcriptional regulator, transcriptional repressor for pyruvate dehydrogenase complex
MAEDTPRRSLQLPERESTATEVTRALLSFLQSGEVLPGGKIPPERQLAEELGVGRSAVREAIKSLSFLGMLVVRQGDGTYLAESGSDLLPQVIEWGLMLGEPRIRDLIEARAHIETTVAALAAERATDAGVAELKQLLQAMADAGAEVEPYVEADIAFHLHLAHMSENEVFVSLVTSLRSLLGVWATRVLVHAGETHTSLRVHKPIVAAVAKRDPEAARAAMAAHMARARTRLETALDGKG